MTPEAIKATGAVVRLSYKRHPLGQPNYWAKIFDVVTGKEQGHLQSADIKLIEDGIKISGWEGFESKVQIWWCVPLTPEQNADLKAALERIRPGQKPAV
ncbi:hypothetical protein LP416_27760 [Polaromonas sp. P2-4]|nr:hypothetical protein LP416_27760 [Polaromonas sp. P2-4]